MGLKIIGILISQAAFISISLCIKRMYTLQGDAEKSLRFIIADMIIVLSEFPMFMNEMLLRYTSPEYAPVNEIFMKALADRRDFSSDIPQRLKEEGAKRLGKNSFAESSLNQLVGILRETDRYTMIGKLKLLDERLQTAQACNEAARKNKSGAYCSLVRMAGALVVILCL